MLSRRRLVGTALGFAACLVTASATRAASSPPPRERIRLAQIDRIARTKSAERNWQVLLVYLKTGPTFKVRFESASLLAQVSNARLKNSLVRMASDKSLEPGTRTASVAALKGSIAHVTDEDIERMLASDEDMRAVFDGTLEVAAKAKLSLEQVKAILDRYDKGRPNVRGNRNVLIIIFAGQHLKSGKGKSFARKIRPVLGLFLIECAHKAGPKPPNLRGHLGTMMADNHVRGAAAVLIESVKDGLRRQERRERPYNPAYVIRGLRRLTGTSMGYDQRTMKPGDPETVSVVEKWLAWWEENKDNPKYRLPSLKPKAESTVPAAGSGNEGDT